MLLAIDTSTGYAGLALHDGERVLAEQTWYSGRHHTEQVLLEAARLLRLAGVDIAALTAIGAATGPGSFTGVRVGLSVAKGLALARGIPLYGVMTLDAMADAFLAADLPVRPVIEAGRARWVTALYRREGDSLARRSGPDNVDLAGLGALLGEATLVCGELDPRSRAELRSTAPAGVRFAGPAAGLRRAGFVAEGALRARERGEPGDPALADAIYVAR